ncbi:MAG: glycogen branching protein [Solobacterium sp.]|nr:glycogen branching protein [Solobacterium sp.]
MKLAYLLYSGRKYYDIVPVCRQLVRQGDHVFIMVSDDKARDEVTVTFAGSRRVHISRRLEFAQEGDMSLARGTLLQIGDALEYEDAEFDYFINLTEGMLPLKPRAEIVSFLEQNPGDYYYVDRTEDEDPKLREKTLKYYTYTNMLVFPTSKWVRWNTKVAANFLNLIGVRRTLDEKINIGSPWFILSKETAKVLAENYPYCSDKFKLSWYPEENVYSMMINKFLPGHEHINKDMRVVGPTGSWIESQGARPLTREVWNAHPEALFGGTFFDDIDEELYNEVLEIYNRDYEKELEDKKRDISEQEFNDLVSKL